MSSGWTSRVIPALELRLEELGAWDEICRSQEHLRSPFLSSDYIRAVARSRPLVYVCVILAGGAPLAFLPFQFRTGLHRLFRAAERVGAEMTDYFGLIAPPGFAADTQTILRLARLSHLYFTHLDESQLCHGLPAGQPEIGLQVRIRADGESYWEHLGRLDHKLVADLNRRERQLERDYGPIRFCPVEQRWSAPLSNLIAYKRRQYQRTGRPDLFAVSWRRKLLENLCASGSTNCRGVISSLYAGPVWVASQLSLCSRQVLHNCFPVYNPALARYSPGRLLMKSILQSAPSLGVELVDRGAGDTPAKRDFANTSHRYYRGAWSIGDGRSAACRVAYSMVWRAARFRPRTPAVSSATSAD